MRIKSPLFVLSMALLLCLAIVQLILPDKTFSDMENRPLRQMAAPALDTVLSGQWMQDMEVYVADQFPARDTWMNAQAIWDAALLRNERNGILLGRDGWLFEANASLPERTALANARAIGKLAVQADIPVTFMLAPLSSAVYPQQLPRWYPAQQQDALLDMLYAEASPAQAADVLDPLRAASGDVQCFFRTDHHWTPQGARIGYLTLLEAWGLPGTNDATPTATLPTYGSYYARAPSPLVQADAFTLVFPEGITLTIDGEAQPGLYDAAAMADARDKYAQLLWGNHGRITLTSDAAGGTLLVIKDSYANALLPLLSAHFSRIEAIDPRYFAGDLLSVIEETEAESILCLYGLTTFTTDRNLLLLSADWGG